MKPNLTNAQIYFGEERAPQTELMLRAGPLRLIFQNGVFRYVRLGYQEIVRSVYLAVRDHKWLTVPGTLVNLKSEVGAESFKL